MTDLDFSRVNWQAVAAVASAVAALAAAAAAWLTKAQWTADRAERYREQRRSYFERTVAVPADAAIDRFYAQVLNPLEGTAKEVTSLCQANAAVGSIDEAIQRGVDGFNEVYLRFRPIVVMRCSSVKSTRLRRRVAEALDRLQDDVVHALTDLARTRAVGPTRDALERGVTELRQQVFREVDPDSNAKA